MNQEAAQGSSAATVASMAADLAEAEAGGEPFHLAMINGDLSYARGIEAQWDNFLHQLQPVASAVPTMVVQGNHERDWPGTGDAYKAATDSGGECGVPAARRMPMPAPRLAGVPTPAPAPASGVDPSAEQQLWYSFNYGEAQLLRNVREMGAGGGGKAAASCGAWGAGAAWR